MNMGNETPSLRPRLESKEPERLAGDLGQNEEWQAEQEEDEIGAGDQQKSICGLVVAPDDGLVEKVCYFHDAGEVRKTSSIWTFIEGEDGGRRRLRKIIERVNVHGR